MIKAGDDLKRKFKIVFPLKGAQRNDGRNVLKYGSSIHCVVILHIL